MFRYFNPVFQRVWRNILASMAKWLRRWLWGIQQLNTPGDPNSIYIFHPFTSSYSRGFGFVTFADNEAVEKVTQFGIHTLDGKKIDPKVAFPKESAPKVKHTFVRTNSNLTFISEKFYCLICESIWGTQRVKIHIWNISIVIILFSHQMVTRTKKIFVGGLSTTTTLDEVKGYFAKFGEVQLEMSLKWIIYTNCFLFR